MAQQVRTTLFSLTLETAPRSLGWCQTDYLHQRLSCGFRDLVTSRRTMAYWEELWGLELRSGLARGCSEEQPKSRVTGRSVPTSLRSSLGSRRLSSRGAGQAPPHDCLTSCLSHRGAHRHISPSSDTALGGWTVTPPGYFW